MHFKLIQDTIPIRRGESASLVPPYFLKGTITMSLKLTVGRAPSKELRDLFGIFFEDLNHAADGGLYAELLQNRSFEFAPVDNPSYHRLTAWETIQRGASTANCHVESHTPLNGNNPHYLVLEVTKAGKGGGVRNLGFNSGIAVREGEKYNFSCWARRADTAGLALQVRLESDSGEALSDTLSFGVHSDGWEKLAGALTACATCFAGRLALYSEEAGAAALDMVSLFPADTYKGHGMRRDLALMLEDMHPKFMRFPGGCLVHDGTLDERDRSSMYRWKNTIGPAECRPARRSGWGYNQTLGLGYYEYFQFCEDIGAKPLPVLPGAWDPHHDRGAPLDELGPWIDDALDLIEFANGGAETVWGGVRAELGHPEPFGLEYLAIGNEEVGQGFFDRFEIIYKAVRERHPEIKIIGTSGPFAAGGEYERGWKYARKLGIDLVDEHYYQSPEWFLANVHRYDSFDPNGPKVFLGEYATQGSAWGNALSEAAYMIGLEKAPAVGLACYAPMLCNTDYQNWNPDMIYFDNHRAYGTPSYYVQKLFMNYQGDVLLPLGGLPEPETPLPEPIAGPVTLTAGSSDFSISNLTFGGKPCADCALPAGEKLTLGGASGFTLEFDAVEQNYHPGRPQGNRGLTVRFGSADLQSCLTWELGGWQNKDSIIGHNYRGRGTVLSQSEFSFVEGQQRHFKLTVEGRKISAWVDSQPLHEVEDRPLVIEPLYASASLDKKGSAVIVKAVNVLDEPQEAEFDLSAWELSGSGRAFTLSGDPAAENSFEAPENICPVESAVQTEDGVLHATLPGHSLTVFVLPIK